MPTQLLSLLRYLPRRARQERHDHQVQGELNWRGGAPSGVPRGLSLQWLGTSGFRLRSGGYSLLIDPYATRVPLGVALGRAPVSPDRERVDRHLPRADAVLIGHTHFDRHDSFRQV